MHPLSVFSLYAITALAEIAGCYSIYAWLKLGKPVWWILPGIALLVVFGWLLTFHPGPAGRIYAAYGAVYILASIAWMKVVESHSPDRWDLLGAGLCMAGAAVIYLGPRN